MLGHIAIDDINDALPRALPMLAQHGVKLTAASMANANETIRWPGLFVTEYRRPTRNVLFDPVRDANPMFHYLESMWILAGREDVKFLSYVLPRMAEYSDDGKVFHGAYGYRLRHWDDMPMNISAGDQIEQAIALLQKEPTSRQVVMSIWDPTRDLGRKTKDMPCNDMVMLEVQNGQLNIVVNNRSNDAVLGAYGANAVQFSMLQMYMAARIGVGVGTYWQVSRNFHVYSSNPYWKWFGKLHDEGGQLEIDRVLAPARTAWNSLDDRNFFNDNVHFFEADLQSFFVMAEQAIDKGGDHIMQFSSCTPIRTAVSMWNVLHWHRKGNTEAARTEAWSIEPDGWRKAAFEWLQRREAKKETTK